MFCAAGGGRGAPARAGEPLLDAGGTTSPRLPTRGTPPAHAEAAAVPLDRRLPDVPGALDVVHPHACEELLQPRRAVRRSWGASASGAGRRSGEPPRAIRHGSAEHILRCRCWSGRRRTSTCAPARSGRAAAECAAHAGGGMRSTAGRVAVPTVRPGHRGELLYLMFPRPAPVRLPAARREPTRPFAGRTGRPLPRRVPPVHPASRAPRAVRRGPTAGPCAFYPDERHLDDQPYAPGWC